MARPASEHPTELELSILKVLWQKSPQTVQGVRDELASAGRELAHSSVITMMNIMVRKQYLKREKVGRAFEFTPLIEQQGVGRRMLGDIVDRVFGGSASAVMLELFETSDVDSEELAAIRKVISRKARELNQ
jgi:BlaI family transcriptional regulator, penicillinase repressor